MTMHKMFKRTPSYPNVLSILLAISIMALVLLAGSGLSIAGQVESPSPPAPSDIASKTVGDAPPEAEGQDAQSEPQSSTEIKPISPSSEAEKWTQRYEKLVDGINDQSLDDEDADKFYQELNNTLRDIRIRLRGALAESTPDKPKQSRTTQEETKSKSPGKNPARQDAKDTPSLPDPAESNVDRFYNVQLLKAELTTLYTLRIQVLEQISPGLRDMVTGTGVDGVQSFKEEVEYFLLMLHVRIRLLPQFGRRMLDEVLSAPTPVIWLVFKFMAVFLIFFWWRRWAVQGIPKIRSNILDIKTPSSIHKWLAKFLWYLIHVRKPIEWGIVLWIIFNVVSTSEGQLIYHSLWMKAKWILTIWFMAILVGAMSTKGSLRLNTQSANLRLRSLRAIASWLLVAGLGLSITRDLVGQGTSYAWYWIFCKLFALLLLFLLIRWWREESYRMLAEIPQLPAYIHKVLRYNRGFTSYLGTVLGAVYLMVDGFRRWVLRGVTGFEGGRYFVANLTRLEAMRVSERMSQKIEGDPISNKIRARLFADEGRLVESIGQNSLERMTHLVEQEGKGSAVVVAERGVGKTHLFSRIESRFENKMMFYECLPGGIGHFQKTFAESLDLNASDLTPTTISERLRERRIKVVGLDSLHRLSRPAFGGQRDIDHLAELLGPLQNDVFWFYGVNWAAWQYISRVRSSRLFLDDVLRLPLWTEEQIRELIELRSAQAGIEPDFGNLILPRQFDDIDYDTVEDRNRFGFYRILWNASDGNPMVSLQLWADSLRMASGGRILVSLPQLPATSELEKVDMTVLLILRVIAQSELASQEEIVDSLRFPAKEVTGGLHLAISRGWVEAINDRYCLTWKWFRSITRVLARKNLLVRTTLGG